MHHARQWPQDYLETFIASEFGKGIRSQVEVISIRRHEQWSFFGVCEAVWSLCKRGIGSWDLSVLGCLCSLGVLMHGVIPKWCDFSALPPDQNPGSALHKTHLFFPCVCCDADDSFGVKVRIAYHIQRWHLHRIWNTGHKMRVLYIDSFSSETEDVFVKLYAFVCWPVPPLCSMWITNAKVVCCFVAYTVYALTRGA